MDLTRALDGLVRVPNHRFGTRFRRRRKRERETAARILPSVALGLSPRVTPLAGCLETAASVLARSIVEFRAHSKPVDRHAITPQATCSVATSLYSGYPRNWLIEIWYGEDLMQ